MSQQPPLEDHWESIWSDSEEDEVSWFEPAPATSLELIEATGIDHGAPILDAGGGASRLVDHLLDRGYTQLTVADLSSHALAKARQRLGDRAEDVRWVETDILDGALPGPFELWHDRAVFHFLTDPADRARYRAVLDEHLAPGGHVVVATFHTSGPDTCSGLRVQRYDEDGLVAALPDSLALVEARQVDHETPWGDHQAFQYAVLEKP